MPTVVYSWASALRSSSIAGAAGPGYIDERALREVDGPDDVSHMPSLVAECRLFDRHQALLFFPGQKIQARHGNVTWLQIQTKRPRSKHELHMCYGKGYYLWLMLGLPRGGTD